MRDIELASSIIGDLRECFMCTDYVYVDSALLIADTVCGVTACCPGQIGPDGNDDAKSLIMAVGHVLGMVLDWKEASPETIGKVEAIRRIADSVRYSED
jgi:hypothetical protein